MDRFRYVTKNELAPIRDELRAIITETQDILRKQFTFQFRFVGSIDRNMVTYDSLSNIGIDFDVNFEVNDGRKYSAAELKHKIIWALDYVARKYGYDHAEDSTRVITIKFKDRKNSRIHHSCDFAIVRNYMDNGHTRQKYIHYNKSQRSYIWENQPEKYYLLREKEAWIRDSKHQNNLRKLYLEKKNHPINLDKSSHSLYAEAVHEICQKYGYYG